VLLECGSGFLRYAQHLGKTGESGSDPKVGPVSRRPLVWVRPLVYSRETLVTLVGRDG
jgi:hypothetical protein